MKVFTRCKRKKIEFNIDEAVNEVCYMNWNIKQITELAQRVKEKGKKATINGLHLDVCEYYRQELVNEMVKHGLDPCKYGYERFVRGNNKWTYCKILKIF